MSSAQSVLIVGGGIAGITLGLGLKKRGIRAEIVEVNSEWAIPGLGIALLGPTLRALKAIGLIDSCVRAGFGYSTIKNFSATGAVMGVVDLPPLCGPAYPASVGMLRVALHRILLQALEAAGLSIELGQTIHSIKQTPEFAEVEFTTGRRDRFDLVVGADGAYSKVRALLLGSDAVPRATGQTIWRATVERPNEVGRSGSFSVLVIRRASTPYQIPDVCFSGAERPARRATNANLAKAMRDEGAGRLFATPWRLRGTALSAMSRSSADRPSSDRASAVASGSRRIDQGCRPYHAAASGRRGWNRDRRFNRPSGTARFRGSIVGCAHAVQ